MENIANIRVPVIAAIEGRAHVHSEYALLANVIVAAEGATFQDVAHFAAGVVPGDGIFTAWSYRAGAGRAEAFLLNPQPLPARTAYEWDLVILGGGTGSTIAAWTFTSEGKQVAVAERKYIGGSMPEHRVLAEQEHHPQRESRIVLSPKQAIRRHTRRLRD